MQSLSLPPLQFPATALRRRRIPTFTSRSIKSELKEENNPLIQSAINSASLRLRETNRPEPLFIDPYAACFLPPYTNKESNIHQQQHYSLATKFIDDKLLHTAKHIDGLKQVVLFTDGMDTRPYRLNWPTSTMIFDLSPEKVFEIASNKLQSVGARIPKSCLFFHIPMEESENIEKSLRSKGFSGNRPSIWAMQGLPIESESSFEAILSGISSLAMNECYFIGELDARITLQSDLTMWMEKLFMRNGFKVKIVSYEEIAASLGVELHLPVNGDTVLFIAQQLKFSDDQMEKWRLEFQRVEEDGDEQGFEEL